MIDVAGNNLATIVCCSELVRHGFQVRHISNHNARLGGHFAGLLYKEKRIDLGMVLLEPRFDLIETDITEYQGQFGKQVNQFNQAVFSWLNSRNTFLNLIPILSHFKSKLVGDVVIADDLSFLDLLSPSEQHAIIEEIMIQIKEAKHHPRDKAQSTFFQETSLREVYCEMYGPTFSKYLLGNLELLAGQSGPEIVAQFHRLLWSPLYYPENILSFLKTGNSGIPVLEFFVPNNNSVAQLVENMIVEMRNSPNYSSLSLPSEQYFSRVNQSVGNNTSETVTFVDERELIDENVNAPGTMVAFVIAGIDSNLEQVVHNLDTESKWYRATLRGHDLGVAVIELGKITPDETDASLFARASQCAKSLGVGTLFEPILLRSNIYWFRLSFYSDTCLSF